MPFRWINVRTVEPGANIDVVKSRPLSLWRVALAAAEETIHGAPIASAWLRLFASHLSASERILLRWRDDLAESTELRRTFSGLYGRYFARALLASELGITDLISLGRDGTHIPGGVRVERVDRGDIPDWIGWDAREGSYVLAEAKGRLTGSEQEFLCRTPRCVTVGKEQFKRVEVRDASGRMVADRSWVAAILWSTDERDRAPVSILWDPPSDGEPLGPEEVHQHANAIRNHRNDIIASRLGNPDFVVRVAIKPSEGGTHPPAEQSIDHSRSHLFDRVSKEQHVSDYQAAVISALGIQPIRNDADLQETQALRQRTKNNGESVMIFGISDTRSEAGRSQERPWVSYNGIASTDGLSLFSLADAELKAS